MSELDLFSRLSPLQSWAEQAIIPLADNRKNLFFTGFLAAVLLRLLLLFTPGLFKNTNQFTWIFF